MTPLERRLRERIAAGGPMPVAEYMALALADSEHGYYTTRDPLGAAGDFVTAPEISQVFGELVGLWCAVVWRAMGAPHRVVVAELGPGRGTLMADALRAAAAVPDFRAAAEIHLVETSPVLHARQRAVLADVDAVWHDSLDDVPAGPLLLIANEFFDALPVEQFVRTADGWRRRCVGLDPGSDALCFEASATLAEEVAALIPAAISDAPVGSLCEAGPAARALAGTIGRRLVAAGGAALIVDYGPSRSGHGETLQAVARHRYADALAAPGEADLTAHVDFQALATAAAAAGAVAHGPEPQGAFLGRLGIAARLARLVATADPAQAEALRAGCHRLIDRDEMGTLFKALALTAPGMPVPPGFEGDRLG